MDEMKSLFSLDRIGNANAKFDRAKLLAFNTQTAEAATPQRLRQALRDYLSVNPDSPLNHASDDQLFALLAMKKGFRTLREVDESCRFFFTPDDEIAYDVKAVEKVLRKDNNAGLTTLRALRDLLASAQDWQAVPLESAIKQYGEAHSLGLGQVAQPIRVALSGTTVSPPIFQSLEFLCRESALGRWVEGDPMDLDRCLKTVG